MEAEIKNLNDNIQALTERINYIIFRLPGIESKINSLFQYLIDKEIEIDARNGLKIRKMEQDLMNELSESFSVFINRNNPLLVQLELDKYYPATEPNINYRILVYRRPITIYSFPDEFLSSQLKKAEDIIYSKCKDIFCVEHGTLPIVKNNLDIIDNTFKIVIECCCLLHKENVLKYLTNQGHHYEPFFTDKLDIKV